MSWPPSQSLYIYLSLLQSSLSFCQSTLTTARLSAVRLTWEAVILLNHANLWNVTRFSKDSTRVESCCSGASCDNLVVIKFSVFQLLFSFSDLWYFCQDRRQRWHQSMRLPTGMQFWFWPNKWLLVGLAATTTATTTCQKATATPNATTTTATTATFDNKRQTTRCQVVWQ